MTIDQRRHVLLVGLPGSGKTTAGHRAARQLGAPFIDIDRLIERDAGARVAVIFAQQGESAFRAMERDQVERALSGPAAVIAPGGGWAAQPGNWESIAGRALVVYLETQPATAARRAAPAGTRPLLQGGEPGERMIALLAQREQFYRLADEVVSTDDRTTMQVAHEVVALARSRGGW